MSNPWFRLYVEFANDPKIQMMSEAMQRRYVMLLCLQASGDLQKLDDESIAWSLRISVADLLETKASLISSRLIGDGWTIVDWPQHKPGSDRPKPISGGPSASAFLRATTTRASTAGSAAGGSSAIT